MMKKLILAIAFLLLAVPAWPATYTVTQTGAGSDYSQLEFEALSGDYSDDVFTFSGTITLETALSIYGTAGHPVTLDGYAAGSCDTSDGTWPAACTASAAVLNPGGGSGSAALTINLENQYIDIQDFEITNAQYGILGYNDAGHINIKRCYIHDSPAYNGSRAVYFTYTGGVGSHITVGGASGDGIIAKNIGIDTGCSDIEFYGAAADKYTDIVISYNRLYSAVDSRGIDGITLIRTGNFLIEKNVIHSHNDRTSTGGNGENAMDIKGGCYNGIIRHNVVYDNLKPTEPAILVQTGDGGGTPLGDTHDIYIYGNNVKDNTYGITAAYPRYISSVATGAVYNIYVFSNIITGNKYYGIGAIKDASALDYDNLYIFNNTLSGNAFDHDDWNEDPITITSSHTGIYLSSLKSGGTVHVKNNVVEDSRSTEADYRQMYFSAIARVTLDDNHYYDPDGGATIWNGASDESATTTDTNGTISDPTLTAAFQLDTGSPAIDAGTDLGSGNIATVTVQGVNYDVPWGFALGPLTTWSDTAPGDIFIDVEDRDATGWDRGAFAYLVGGADAAAPTVTITTADPQSITADSLSLSFTCTDANGVSTAKWRLGAAPGNGTGTPVSGSSPFTAVVSGFSEGANTLYAGCSDPTGNWGSDSITVNLNSGYPPAAGDGTVINGIAHAVVNGACRSRNGIGATYSTDAYLTPAPSSWSPTCDEGDADQTQDVVFTASGGTVTLGAGAAALTTGTVFAIDSDGCSSSSVTVGNDCTVTLSLDCTTAATPTDTLTVTSDASDSPKTVALSGTISEVAACNAVPYRTVALSGTSGVNIGYSTTLRYVGQQVSAAQTVYTLCQDTVYLSRVAGDISGKTYYARVYSTDGSNNLSGLKGQSDGVSGNNAWSATGVDFTFSTPVEGVGPGDAIVITTGAEDASNYAKMIYRSGADFDTGYSIYGTWNSSNARTNTSSTIDFCGDFHAYE